MAIKRRVVTKEVQPVVEEVATVEETVVEETPAKKAPAKKAPAKKAPAKKPVVKAEAEELEETEVEEVEEETEVEEVEEETEVEETPVKKAPAKKAVVKKAPVKKAPIKVAPVVEEVEEEPKEKELTARQALAAYKRDREDEVAVNKVEAEESLDIKLAELENSGETYIKLAEMAEVLAHLINQRTGAGISKTAATDILSQLSNTALGLLESGRTLPLGNRRFTKTNIAARVYEARADFSDQDTLQLPYEKVAISIKANGQDNIKGHFDADTNIFEAEDGTEYDLTEL